MTKIEKLERKKKVSITHWFLSCKNWHVNLSLKSLHHIPELCSSLAAVCFYSLGSSGGEC
jgi:hypothetical protein